MVGGSRLLLFSPTQGAQSVGEKVKSPDVLDHATSEIASGSKLGIDATKKLPGEGFKRP
jgi:3-polyprenyl-4-hydroxybenzoate decarboxylase